MKRNIFSLIKKRVIKVNIIYYFDLIFFCLIILYLIYNLSYGLLSIIDIGSESNWKDLVYNMADSNQPQNRVTHTTNVTIINGDSGWSNVIRQLFIYGSGALRLNLIRTGSPGSRGFVIGSTLLADGVSKVINNTINDPEYVIKHIENWKRIREDGEKVEITIDDNTSKKIIDAMSVDKGHNFISSDDLSKITEGLFNSLMSNFKGILEPVFVSYSNEILLQQIYGLSVLLFILSLLIVILFIGFILNITIYAYSDRILNYFTNRYIRAYIKLNRRLIGIEIFCLSISILYFLYVLSRGLHFICTHPVNLN